MEARHTFETLLHSVLIRSLERSQADAALYRLLACHGKARSIIAQGIQTSDPALQSLIAGHAGLKKNYFERLTDEYRRDTVIVSATILDSFLTDVTRFLLLLHPKAIPKDKQVRVSDVLSAGSYGSMVTQIVEQCVHEVGYKSLVDRVAFLRDKFGIDTSVLSDAVSQAEKVAAIRNRLVHVVSRYAYTAGDGAGSIQLDGQAAHVIGENVARESIVSTQRLIAGLSRQISTKLFGEVPQLVLELEKDVDELVGS